MSIVTTYNIGEKKVFFLVHMNTLKRRYGVLTLEFSRKLLSF